MRPRKSLLAVLKTQIKFHQTIRQLQIYQQQIRLIACDRSSSSTRRATRVCGGMASRSHLEYEECFSRDFCDILTITQSVGATKRTWFWKLCRRLTSVPPVVEFFWKNEFCRFVKLAERRFFATRYFEINQFLINFGKFCILKSLTLPNLTFLSR